MNKWLITIGLAVLVTTVGCIESVTVVEVGKDGSGRVLVKEFYSPQITQMLEGFAGMMAPDMSGGDDSAKPVSMFSDTIQNKTNSMGPGVTLVSSRETSNAAGWKGFHAVYAFEDINRIQVSVGDSDIGSQQAGAMGEMQESDAEDQKGAYSFRFTPGEIARLEIIPPPVKETAVTIGEADEMDEDVEDMPPEMMEGMEDMAAEMMTGMMKPMLKGMRMSLVVKVDGEITETNASYPSKTAPNAILVMDLAMDKLLDNEEAFSILMKSQDDPNAIYKLNSLNIAGVRLEEPEKTISVSFE